MYADHMTAAMKQAIEETSRRRALQEEYNLEHGITPTTIVRAVMNINPAAGTIDYFSVPKTPKGKSALDSDMDIGEKVQALRLEMFEAAENLDFEKAARLRDELKRLQGTVTTAGVPLAEGPYEPYVAKRKKGGRAPSGVHPAVTAPKRTTRKFKPR
jgi:excinuclease ABC subunit B